MTRTSLAMLTLVLLLPGRSAAQGEQTPPEVRTAATATRSVRPDLAVLTMRFWADCATPAGAGRNLAARTDSLRRALVAAGVPRDSVVNGSRWYWWPGRLQPHVTARWVARPDGRGGDQVADTTWRALETVTVRIRDLGRVGAAIDTALAHEITDIQGPQFIATDVLAAEEEALREATTRARRHAEAIAEAAGGRLGRIVLLNTVADRGESYDSRAYILNARGAAAADGATVVVPPSVTVSVTVYARWVLVER